MTARTVLYNLLCTHPYLTPMIVGLDGEPRVFAKKSMNSAVEDYPFIVYKFGNNTSEDLSEDTEVSRQFVQIFIYDYSDTEAADYENIDGIIFRIKLALKNFVSPDDGIIRARYLETSQDLNDETLNAVMKYVRFQLVMKE